MSFFSHTSTMYCLEKKTLAKCDGSAGITLGLFKKKKRKKSGITAFISTLPISFCQHATVDKQLARIFALFLFLTMLHRVSVYLFCGTTNPHSLLSLNKVLLFLCAFAFF